MLNEINILKAEIPGAIFIILSQLNDGILTVERRTPRRALNYPTMNDIFGSRSSYHLADYVMVLMNPEKIGYKEGEYGPKPLPVKGKIYLHLLKARDNESEVVILLNNNLKYNKLS